MSAGVISAATQKVDFLTLLVTELRNQNPLEPMDNQQMAAQMAQISQLELTVEMNANLKDVISSLDTLNYSFVGSLWMARLDAARALLGKTVSFYDTNTAILTEGSVTKLTFDKGDGSPILTVRSSGGDAKTYTISLGQIEGVQA